MWTDSPKMTLNAKVSVKGSKGQSQFLIYPDPRLILEATMLYSVDGFCEN